jgi:hypothetical protein
MRCFASILTSGIAFAMAIGSAQQPSSGGQSKVLKTTKVGGEGGGTTSMPTLLDAGCTFHAAARGWLRPLAQDPQRRPSRHG